MVRLAEQRDIPALVDVWQSAFGDEPAYIEDCLARFAGAGNVFVYDAGAGPVAVLSAVPCEVDGVPGVYHFALATHPAHRGQGYMGRLMRQACEEAARRGQAFAALIPASQSLFGYYRAHGYVEDVGLRHIRQEMQPLPTQEARSQGYSIRGDVGVEEFRALRRRFADVPYVDFPDERMAFVLGEALGQGGRFALAEDGYAVYYVKEGRLAVAELFAQNDDAARGLLGYMARETGCAGVTLTLAGASRLFQGAGRAYPAALFTRLDPSFTTEGLYLRFGIDEVFDKDYERV